MNELQKIEARLAQIANEIETRAAELTAENITALETEVTDLKAKRKALVEVAEKRTALLGAIAEGGGTVVRKFENTAGTEVDKFDTAEYRKAFMNYVLRGTAMPVEYRTDATSTTSDVGAVIPTTVLNKIVEKLEATGMILPLITKTSFKGGVSIPVSTVKPTASWVNEGAGSDKQKHTIGSSGMITFAYHKLRCAVAVSIEVENMAISAFEGLITNNIVEAMTKALEQAIINANGEGKPKGILAETPATGQALEATTLAYADLIKAEAVLPQAYENGAVWCMTKNTFMQYYGLVDEQGQPVGRVNYGIGGKPERFLLGRQVVCCDYLDTFSSSLTAGKIFAFLFNFKDYTLNSNYAMGMKKYEDNATDDMVTKAIMIVDGKVVDKNSLVTLAKKS